MSELVAGSIVVDLQALNQGFNRGMNAAINSTEKLDKTAKNLSDKTLTGLGNVAKSVGNTIKTGLMIGLTGLAGAVSAAGVASVRSAADMQTMGVALETALGSTEAAAKAQAQITKFATKTPYQLEEVMGAFIKLKNMGLDPSEKALTAYGDTASAMGKSLNDMVEAVADAATGEFERLKEFGIRSSKEGDKVKFTFKGVTTTVKMNSEEIQKYLIGLGETNFAGGMDKQSRTLAGRFSTLKDSIGLALGEFAIQSGAVDTLGKAMEWLSEVISGIDLSRIIQYIDKAGSIVRKILSPAIQNLKEKVLPDLALKFNEIKDEVKESYLALKQWADQVGIVAAINGDYTQIQGEFNNKIEHSKNKIEELKNSLIAFIFDGLQQVKDFVVNNFQPEIQRFTATMEALGQIWDSLTTFIFPMIIPILTLVAGVLLWIGANVITGLVYAWQQLRQPVNDFLTAVMELVSPIMQIVIPVIAGIVGILSVLVSAIAVVVMPIIQLLWAIIVQAFKGILETVTGVIKIVSGILNVFIGLIRGLFTGDFSQVMKGFRQIWEGIVKFVGGIVSLIISPFTGMIDSIQNILKAVDLYKFGVDMINGLINGVKDMAGKLSGAVGDTVNGAVNSAKEKLGIKSPSRVFMEIGRYTGEGMAIGINKSERDVQQASLNLASATINAGNVNGLINSNSDSIGTSNISTNNNVSVNMNMNGVNLGSAKDRRDFVNEIRREITDIFPVLQSS